MDLFQPRSAEIQGLRPPFHNRCFILFASYLGSAIALTSTGSIFMHLGPRWTLQLLQDQLKDPFIQDAPTDPSKEDSLIALLGYTFIRAGTSADAFLDIIRSIRNAFAWSFVVPLGFATLAFVFSVVMLMFKIWKGYFEWHANGVGVPEEWRVNHSPSQHDVELVERDVDRGIARGRSGMIEERSRTSPA